MRDESLEESERKTTHTNTRINRKTDGWTDDQKGGSRNDGSNNDLRIKVAGSSMK